MTEREQFEAKFPVPDGVYWHEGNRRYQRTADYAIRAMIAQQKAWEAWQAARATPALPQSEPVGVIDHAMMAGIALTAEGAALPHGTKLYAHPQALPQGALQTINAFLFAAPRRMLIVDGKETSCFVESDARQFAKKVAPSLPNSQALPQGVEEWLRENSMTVNVLWEMRRWFVRSAKMRAHLDRMVPVPLSELERWRNVFASTAHPHQSPYAADIDAMLAAAKEKQS